ncbi:MAG: YkgJ family cysteine cluster protein [Bacillota bacterium]|jgi:Fe-S-cluster containining protein
MGVSLLKCAIDGEMGLDVSVTDPDATVADLLAAMQQPADDPTVFKPFHKQRYAICAGCVNNCCRSNRITPDLVSALALAASLGLSLQQFARAYLNCAADLPYPEFRRRPCPFLRNDRCSVYRDRALICRLYLCTPMSDRLEQLRGAVLLAGETALQQRLLELGIGPHQWQPARQRQSLRQRYQRGELSQERYRREQEQLETLLEHNPFREGKGYGSVRLVDCCPDWLWMALRG